MIDLHWRCYDWIVSHFPLFMLISVIFFYLATLALEYYLLWKNGQKEFKEIDSAQLIQAMVKRERKTL